MDSSEIDDTVAFAEQAGRGMREDDLTWGTRLDEASHRLQTALQWTLDRADDAPDAQRGLRLATALSGYWLHRGQLAIGRSWIDRLLAARGAQGATAARGWALNAGGIVAFRQGERDIAAERFHAALAMASGLADATIEVVATTNLARIALRDRDAATVRALAGRARERARTLDDPGAEALPLHLLAAGTRMAGDLDAAEHLYRESLELNRNLGREPMVTTELLNLGSVAKRLGRADQAARLLGEALERALSTKDEYTTAPVVLGLAGAAVLNGQPERAAMLLGGARALYAAAGLVPDPDDAEEDEWTEAKVHEALGADAAARAIARGRAMGRAAILDDAAAVTFRP